MNNKDRLINKENEMTVVFISQCRGCKWQSNYDSCEKFEQKPNEYIENKLVCPKKR